MATRRLQIVFAASTRGALAGIREVGSGISGIDRQLRSLGQRARDMAGLGQAFLGLGASIKAGFAMATMEAAKFQREMANVSTIVDTTKVSMAAMRKELLDLPSELGDATELAKALNLAISSGVDPTKGVAFVGEAAKLARAGLSDVTKTVDVLTTIINAYGMKAEDAGRISDMLFRTVDVGKTTIEELASSLGPVIPVAASMNVGLHEVLASIATLTAGGYSTAEAVTALKSTMMDVLKPTESAKLMAEALGIQFSAAELKGEGLAKFVSDISSRFSQLSDPARLAALKTQLLGENMEKVRTKTGLISKEGEKLVATLMALEEGAPEEAMARLFDNVRGLGAVMAITGKQSATMAANLKAIPDSAGASDTAWGKQRNTILMLWEGIGNSFRKLMIQLGQMGEGPLTQFLQRMLGGLEGLRKWVSENDVLTQKILVTAGAVSTFLVGVGGVMTIMPRLLTVVRGAATYFGGIVVPLRALVAALPGVVAGGAAAAGVFTRLGSVVPLLGRVLLGLVGGPIGAVITGVTLLGVAWAKNLGGIRDTVTKWFGQMKPALVGGWERLSKWVVETWEWLSFQARFWFKRVEIEVREALKAVTAEFQAVWPDIKRIWNVTMAVLVPVAKFWMENLVETFRTSWAAVRLVFSVAWEAISGIVGTAVQVVWNLLKASIGLWSGILTAGMKAIQGDWTGAWDALAEGVSKAATGINDALKALLQGLLETITGMATQFFDKGGELIQAVADGMWSRSERTIETAAEIGRRASQAMEDNFQPQLTAGGREVVMAGGKAITDLDFIRQFTRGSAIGDLSKMTPATMAATVKLIQEILMMGFKPIISSVTGGKHTDGSYHYSGMAVDFGLTRWDDSLLPYAQELKAGIQAATSAGFLRAIDELNTSSPHLHVSMGQGEGFGLQGGGGVAAVAGSGTSNWDLGPGVDQTAAAKAARQAQAAARKLAQEQARLAEFEAKKAAEAGVSQLKARKQRWEAERKASEAKMQKDLREAEGFHKLKIMTEERYNTLVETIHEGHNARLADIARREREEQDKHLQDMRQALQQSSQAAQQAVDDLVAQTKERAEKQRSILDSVRQLGDDARRAMMESRGDQRGIRLLELDRSREQAVQQFKEQSDAIAQLEFEHQQRLRNMKLREGNETRKFMADMFALQKQYRGAELAARVAELQAERSALILSRQMEYQTELKHGQDLQLLQTTLAANRKLFEENDRIQRVEAERLATSAYQQMWFDTLESIKNAFTQNLAQLVSGQITFADFCKNIFQQILASFGNLVANMVSKWIEGWFEMESTAKSKAKGLFGGGGGGGIGGVLGLVGSIFGFSEGGLVPGIGRGDKVPALLEPGEYVLPRRVVEAHRRFQRPLAFASGGLVPSGASLAGAGLGVNVTFVHYGNITSEVDARALKRELQETVAEATRRGGSRG